MRALVTIAGFLLMASGLGLLVNGDAAYTREQASERLARDSVTDGPTFRFDGIRNSLVLLDTVKLRIQDGWQYNYQFACAHSGYGNRSGQKLLQVVTPHTAMVQVIQGKVVRAILDSTWDELGQAFVNARVSQR